MKVSVQKSVLLFAAAASIGGCSDDPVDNLPDTGGNGSDTRVDDVLNDSGMDVSAEVVDTLSDGSTDVADGSEPPTFDVPLAADSPWPKFRRDARQTGYSPVVLEDDGRALFVFPTGKGIFSSPVVGGDGTVYIGSADRTFYAINPDGTERWAFDAPEEIIDSSGLLDDRGNVYFGAGDGHVYALNASTGEEVWRFEADEPGDGAFIRWFEGNVAIGPDGTLYAPNDNFYVYAINRDDGTRVRRFRMPDQTWSLPAIDPENGNLYMGNNNVVGALGNVFAYEPGGRLRWFEGTDGTIAASPLLYDDQMIVGGFDGILRSFDTADGDLNWSFETRDHIYASPSLHPDGFLVQASADGTVFAVNPENGEQEWAYDWGAPIRSSPAIDGSGIIYMGTGDGHLLVLNSDGTLRWALRLIEDDRDDLNASPALGTHAIYLAGESGGVFGVPFDYCLRSAESENPACR
ncbi:MAG: PQQ-like beta-propeller repeat protein, partial [Myxococcales bacterium]|nr:PQQ-like beta-propeller repeat protein [Myxococcales bacterium]